MRTLIPLLFLLDAPYYLFRALADAFQWLANVWPPFSEIARDLRRRK